MWFIILGIAGGAHAAQNAPAANSRYVIQGDTVYDKKTDLTWQRCSVGQRWAEGKGCVGVIKTFTFDDAQRQGNGMWRVPTKNELGTLIDQNRGRRLTRGHFRIWILKSWFIGPARLTRLMASRLPGTSISSSATPNTTTTGALLTRFGWCDADSDFDPSRPICYSHYQKQPPKCWPIFSVFWVRSTSRFRFWMAKQLCSSNALNTGVLNKVRSNTYIRIARQNI